MKSTAFSFNKYYLDVYRGVKLENINLEIPKNKTSIVYGPYNSGKTLFLQTFSRMYEEIYSKYQNKGELLFSNKNILEYDKCELRKKVAYLDNNFLNALKYFKIEELISLHYGKKVIFENFSQSYLNILEELDLLEDLSKLYSKKINCMNNFTRLKLLIFLSFTTNSEFVIYDNFLDKADDDTVARIFNHIANNKEKKSYLISTRNIKRFLPYADLLLFIKNGKIIYHGDSGGFLNLEET